MKKIFIVGLILVLLFSFASVSASEIINNDTNDFISAKNNNQLIESDVDDIDLNNKNNILISNSFEDEEINSVTNDSFDNLRISVGSFTDLANEIGKSKNELNLTKDYTYNNKTDSKYKSGISINKQITINGNGHTLNANFDSKIFQIRSSDVILKNISFINGKYEGSGGAISIYTDNNIIDNCSFINNWVFGELAFGGAIDFQMFIGGSTITNCIFKDNGGVYCGALDASCDDILVDNCTFINNNANLEGGAIYLNGDNAVISNCNFVNNYAKNYGGAIHLQSAAYNAKIYNSNFTRNHASAGGAFHATFEVDRLNISNCIFEKNYGNAWGGAVYCSGKLLNSSINHCLFDSNYCTHPNSGKGGAINFGYDLNNSIISDSIFKNNYISLSSTEGNGGAIWWGKNPIDCKISNCSFGGNYIIKRTGNSLSGIYSSIYCFSGVNIFDSTFDIISGNINSKNIEYGDIESIDGIFDIGVNENFYFALLLNNVEVDTFYSNSFSDIFPSLTAGNYTISIRPIKNNNGNIFIIKDDFKSRFIVNKIKPIINISVSEATYPTNVIVSLKSNVDGYFISSVNGNICPLNVCNGYGNVNLPMLNPGKYSGNLYYDGNQNYSSISIDFEINIYSSIKSNDIEKKHDGGNEFYATFLNGNSELLSNKYVVFKIGKIEYSVKTNDKGVAILNVGLKSGKYEITSVNTITGETKTNKLTLISNVITKKVIVKTKLTLKNVKVKRTAKKLILQATLKQGNIPLKNKKITFKFNGKKYISKTNNKGIAKVTIKKLVLKKLKVGKKIKYQATYEKTTVKKTVKVNK